MVLLTCMRSPGFALLALLSAGCSHQEHRYESVLQLVSRSDVQKDDKGEVDQVDFLFEWDPCPGDQFQVVRGGKDFAKCMEKYDKGDYVSVKVKHFWDGRGFYRWDVEEIGGCARPIEDGTEGSYERSQECQSITHFGRESGFDCSRRPFKKLVAICPWMARR
jgi:hypothetical protein